MLGFMSSPITSIPNLGPATAREFARAGITTAEEIREMGADAAYLRLIETGTRPHFIGYYALHMALQGRPWNDCKCDEKAAFRKQFDALKAGSFNAERSELEAFLNKIGVIDVNRR